MGFFGMGGILLGFVYGNCNWERLELWSQMRIRVRALEQRHFIDSVLIQGKSTVSRKDM